MPLEDDIRTLLDEVRGLHRKFDKFAAERQHENGHWATRAELAKHRGVGLDAVDGIIARGEVRVERIGAPPEDRRDRLGRRIDRRRVREWITGAPKTDDQIAQSAAEARGAR